ncbi:MAG: hypothetical protein ACLR3N_06860 [Agathobacter rectalis]
MEGHFLVYENAEEEFDISFQVNSTMDSVIPKDQQELYVKAESACNIIKALENTDKQTKKKYFDKLLSLSQVGLVANPAQTETAEFALMKLKDEIVLVEGKRIKNHYMKYLGIDALIIGAIASIVLGICFYFTRWIGCISVLCIIIGALTGTWVSFGARKFEIEFEDLASLIFALLMNVGLIDVKIGNVDISKAFTDIKPALVIGVLCGLVESKIGIQVYNKAVSLLVDNSEQ